MRMQWLISQKPSFVASRVFEREQTHRRGVLAAMSFLLLFSVSSVFGHHLAEPILSRLLGRDHLLNLCLIALHELLQPVHSAFHLLLVVGGVYGVFDRVRAVARLRSVVRALELHLPSPHSVVGLAAAAVNVDASAIRVMRGLSTPAFTAGLLMPRIYIGEELATRLAPSELSAVIAHEDAHRRRRDPLRLTAWRFLACLLFFLPVLRRLADDMADEAEVAADDAAVTRSGVDPLTLASALLAIAKRFDGRAIVPATAPGFHREEILGRRVRRLAGEESAIGTHLTRRSALLAVVALTAIWVSGLIVAHPLPATKLAGTERHDGQHCLHHSASPLSHLFCRGTAQPTAAHSGECPHLA